MQGGGGDPHGLTPARNRSHYDLYKATGNGNGYSRRGIFDMRKPRCGREHPVPAGYNIAEFRPMMPPKVRAWFAVVGFVGDPSEVSGILGLDPEQAWRAGEGIGGARAPQPEAGWRIRSPLGADADVEEHASALLGRLPQRLPPSLAAPGVHAQFSFAIELGGEMPAISFSPETLRRMAMLDAGIDIDLRVAG